MENTPYFPLFIDISKKKIVVVGAGKIASRRIATLLRFADRVTVIASSLPPALSEAAAAGRIEHIARHYLPGDMAGAELALAATNDPAVNEAVWAECRALGVPVSVASDRSKCDFYFPGVITHEPVVVGVVADGKDHAAARRACDRIRALFAAEEDDRA